MGGKNGYGAVINLELHRFRLNVKINDAITFQDLLRNKLNLIAIINS